MIDELDAIEKDLDGFLKGQGGKQNKFIEEAFLNKNLCDMHSREQVFRQAVTLGKDITSLQGGLQICLHQLEKDDVNYKEAAEKYLLVGDPSKIKQVHEIEQSLTIFYSAMKWIENVSTDLNFQLDLLQKKAD